MQPLELKPSISNSIKTTTAAEEFLAILKALFAVVDNVHY
jgi:hypothetical protein